jgi:hypothetical protein
MSSIFNEDFQDFIRSLNKFEVKYVLVGGYSVIIHGYQRTTGDLDIFVEVSKENYKRLQKTFFDFGMSLFDMSEENFLNTDEFDVFSFGVSPVSIDLLTKMKGCTFDEVYDLAFWYPIEGNLLVKTIHINHLRQAKIASGRFKDLDDLENLG